MEGDNVYLSSERMPWYQGPSLIQVLDGMKPEETEEKSLRFVVQDVYDIDSDKITVGRVEAGILRTGNELIFQPSELRGKVNKIIMYPEELAQAASGDSVGLQIDCKPSRGDVAGLSDNQPIAVTRFLGEVALLEGNLSKGDKLEMKCGTKRARCEVAEIHQRINSETGEVMGRNIDRIEENEAATIVFKSESAVVEPFAEIPELGRFILTRGQKNIGAGVILENG
jgi:elongation factor 1-alpha